MSEFEQELKIDLSALEENWQSQATLYMKHSQVLIDILAERDKLKDKYDYVKAETELDMRNNPEKFKLPKITDASVAAALTIETDVVRLKDQITQLNSRIALHTSVVKAFEHRKKALEGLTQLFVNGYWSEPKISGAFKEKVYNQKQIEKLNDNPRLKRKITK